MAEGEGSWRVLSLSNRGGTRQGSQIPVAMGTRAKGAREGRTGQQCEVEGCLNC